MLTDKDTLENTVKKQHDLIERQAVEIKLAKSQIDTKDAAIDKARCAQQLLAWIQQRGLQLQLHCLLFVMAARQPTSWSQPYWQKQ